MKSLFAIIALCSWSAFGRCPDLTDELAKHTVGIDIECEYVPTITIQMKKKWLKSATESTNFCWTTFRADKVSKLLQIRRLDIVGAEEPGACTYDRDDSTTHLHLQVDKDALFKDPIEHE